MKRAVLLFGIVFSAMSVFAEDNVLQTIEIEPIKDTYNIVLVSDKAVDVKKTVQAPNQINLTLKDIRASKTLNTVYNNVSNVDTVMVEQQGSGVSIFFQADNAESATVSFDAVTPAPVKTASSASSALKLSGPIESYAPIYKEDIETAKTSSLYNRLKANYTLNGIKDSLEEAPSSDMPNKLITFGLVTLFAVAAIRLFKRKEPEIKIGLSQQAGFDNANYGGVQQPIGYYPNSNLTKPFTTVNYGLNAYKNENKNPYETAPMQIHNPRLRNYARKPMPTQEPVTMSSVITASNPVQQAVQTMPKKTTVTTEKETVSNPNIDNLKFLESMTAIYEKSGRHDLARGLKASLTKNNIK